MAEAIVAPIQRATQQTIESTKKNPYFPNEPKQRIHYTYTRRTGHCPQSRPQQGRPQEQTLQRVRRREQAWLDIPLHLRSRLSASLREQAAAGTGRMIASVRSAGQRGRNVAREA